MCRPPARGRFRRRSTPRHHSDKFHAIAVLQGARGPLIAEEGFVIEFDEEAARIETATGGEFAERGGGADLAGLAIDENAESLLDRFRHETN
jgi:hypothetical protein